jgi:precorrin-4 methylase
MSDNDTLRDIVLRMEGTMNTGFATLQGEINLLHSGDSNISGTVGALVSDVAELKARRMPTTVIGSLVGVAALGMSAFTLVRGG